MKKTLCLAIGIILSSVPLSRGKTVTSIVTSSRTSSQIQVNSNEVVRIVSYPSNPAGTGRITIHKDDADIYGTAGGSDTLPAIVIAGPCTIFHYWVGAVGATGASYCTFDISPDVTASAQTLVIPAGTGATISLQCSTNLATWTNIFSQSYTNVPENKFFRMAIERVP